MANRVNKAKSTLFISWSGSKSKEIAKLLKTILENIIFPETGLSCFVSDVDIASGSDWWEKIKSELTNCQLGILCVTKENLKSPWIYFEAGALVARDVPVMPLLFFCDIKNITSTPLKSKQCVVYDDISKFEKMICDINQKYNLRKIPVSNLKAIARNGYELLNSQLKDIFIELQNSDIIDESNIYPSKPTTYGKNTIYVSIPMASVSETDYQELRKHAQELKRALKKIGFNEVICPILWKKDPTTFDGKTKAINDTFTNIKKSSCLLAIYPKEVPSSVLVELGYGIALRKGIAIFHKEQLPYLLEKSGEAIQHVYTLQYNDFSEINKIILSNGRDIFNVGGTI